MTAPTRDEVIQMAREAGVIPSSPYLVPHDNARLGLERLVSAAYACGVAAERDACAKLCESMEYEFKAGHECAAAIHAMPMQKGGEA